MNAFQEKLFSDLTDLDNTTPPFYHKDIRVNESKIYRLFNYKMARYQDFSRPSAKSARGIMFLIDSETKAPLKLVALPMEKFFGYGETPDTMDLDLDEVALVSLKVDGSLLSTYITEEGELEFKSKMRSVYKKKHIFEKILSPVLHEELKELTEDGYTADLEITSPRNRVIVEYEEDRLYLLNVRSRLDGSTLDIRCDEFRAKYPTLFRILTPAYDKSRLEELNVQNKRLAIRELEGFVVTLKSGQMIKVKTVWYMTQHSYTNVDDSSTLDERLFIAVINEVTDELRSLFHYKSRNEDYPLDGVLERIDLMEEKVRMIYHDTVDMIEEFYEENKELERAEYAQLAAQLGRKDLMFLLMKKYKEEPVDYKEFMIKTYAKTTKL